MADQADELGEQKRNKQSLLKQGIKGERGRPILYSETKVRKHFMLTPTAVEVLDDIAAKQGLSGSEALERLLRTIGGKPFLKMANQADELEERKRNKQSLLRQGIKGERGQPILYSETKVRKHFMLTPTAVEVLDDLAAKQDLSGSEALERLLRTIGGKPLKNK